MNRNERKANKKITENETLSPSNVIRFKTVSVLLVNENDHFICLKWHCVITVSWSVAFGGHMCSVYHPFFILTNQNTSPAFANTQYTHVLSCLISPFFVKRVSLCVCFSLLLLLRPGFIVDHFMKIVHFKWYWSLSLSNSLHDVIQQFSRFHIAL